jgi:O-antigen/teichoic acid export membrane protein
MAINVLTHLVNKMGNTSFGAILTMFGKVFSAFLNYLTLVIIARLLSVGDFGIYSFFLSFIAFITVIVSAGADNVLLSLVSKRKEKGTVYYYRTILSVFGLIISCSIVVILGLILTRNFMGTLINIPNYSGLLCIVIWVVFLQSMIIFFRALNQAEFNFVKAVLPENFIRPSILFVFICISLLIGYSSLKVISFGYLLSFLIAATIAFYWKRIFPKGCTVKVNSFDKEVLKLSPQFMVIQLLNQASDFIPIFIMGIFLSSNAIGILRASQQTTLLVSFILISVNMVFAPTISSLFNKNKLEDLKKFYAKTTKWIFVLGGYVTLLLIINAHIVLSLFGSAYKDWSMVLIILAIGQLINASTGSSGYLLLMTRNQRIMIFITFIQVVTVVVLSLVTVKIWGIYGIAFSVSFGIALLNLLQVIFVWVKLKVHSFTLQYIGIIITIVISTLFTWLIQLFISLSNNILQAIFSSIIFTLVFILSFIKLGLSKEEKRSGRKFVKSLTNNK